MNQYISSSPKKEELKEIRSRFVEYIFKGNNKPNGYCEETNDIAYHSFKRELYRRKDYSKMDFIFTSPTIMEDTIPSTALLANSNRKV
uniref:Uncharacterized protein n=1 Tax=Solanum lycopersicum TaxID=4081 RepID=A0A3Q7IVH8_SOLLC